MSLTLEREIREEGHKFSALPALGQLGKDQEPPPAASVLAHADTLEPDGERVQVALGDGASSHNMPCAEVLEG